MSMVRESAQGFVKREESMRCARTQPVIMISPSPNDDSWALPWLLWDIFVEAG